MMERNVETSEKLIAFREGGWTERMHTVPHHGTYQVGLHSWQVAMIIIALHPDPSAALIKACLAHDMPERWVGDTPHTVKKIFNPALGRELHTTEEVFLDELGLAFSLTEEEKKWLAFGDMFEFVMWCDEQMAMGNRLVIPSWRNATAVVGMWLDTGWLPKEAEAGVRSYTYHSSEASNWYADLVQTFKEVNHGR